MSVCVLLWLVVHLHENYEQKWYKSVQKVSRVSRVRRT